jgi:hypothetical protein
MAHGDAREGKWRGNWRMEWVASTLHTPSEHGVSSITTADPHNSAASSRLNWSPRRFKWIRPFRRKTNSGFCACVITFHTQSTGHCNCVIDTCSFCVWLVRSLGSDTYCQLYTEKIRFVTIGHLRTKRSPFWLKAQSVPRSKHASLVKKASRWRLYKENLTLSPETRTININILWEECRIFECLD